ncbi:MAG TPA: acetolactate synthase [Phycisphaerae bacterium]|jgi:hypothetical protein
MSLEPLETIEAQGFPTVRQLSVFMESRVGQLLHLTRLFDKTEIHIVALSIVNAVDCAIIRMIVDKPDEAYKVLVGHEFPVSEAELLVVSLPPGKRALLHTWAALMSGEVNINYTYPLLIQPKGSGAIALHADNLEMAAKVLRSNKLELLDHQDLMSD